MKKINFTAFDFETATYDKMPCQLGLTVVRKGEIVEEKMFLIKPPENRYDIGCVRTHGISEKDTTACKEFNEIWDEIIPYFEHELMVAHNVDFDCSVLENVSNYYKLDRVRTLGFYDTMQLFDKRSLSDIAMALGLTMEKHHDALSDARICAQIFIEYLKGLDLDKLQYPKKKTRKNPVVDSDRIISSEAKTQDLSIVECANNLFYNKKIVISGIFENFPVRNELALLLKKYGANINSSVSKKTDLFIAGSDFGPKKMEKVESLQSEGYGIIMMDENDLMHELIDINENKWL